MSAVGAGGAAFLLPNQWSMLGKLRTIPDTVDEFTGYSIGLDLWAWTVGGVDDTIRKQTASAKVRNVTLAAEIQPRDGARHRATGPRRRRSGRGSTRTRPASAAAAERRGKPGMWAADVWYSVKKHWVLEAQRLIRVTRAGAKPAVTGKLE